MVLDALKKRLHDAANTKGGKWIKELPNALWGLCTQPSKPTGQSPYPLVYGSEAILSADVMWDLLTQNPHTAPSTQQAEQAGLTHELIPKRASQFFLKLTKGNAVRCQSLELSGWYQTVPYLRLKAM
jgi:hypothetical protein